MWYCHKRRVQTSEQEKVCEDLVASAESPVRMSHKKMKGRWRLGNILGKLQLQYGRLLRVFQPEKTGNGVGIGADLGA